MKKCILILCTFCIMLMCVSCRNGNNTSDNKGNGNVAEDMKNTANDIAQDARQGINDITDGTVMDPDHNYNVDEYTANGTQMK